MSKFLKEMDARRARSKMIREAMRAYEDSCRAAKTADQEDGWGGHQEKSGDREGEVHALST